MYMDLYLLVPVYQLHVRQPYVRFNTCTRLLPVDLSIYSSYSDSESDKEVAVDPKAIADAFRGSTGADRQGHQESGGKTKNKTRSKDKPSKWDSRKREGKGKGEKGQTKTGEGEQKPVRDREVTISSRREVVVTEVVKHEKKEEREPVEAVGKWRPMGTSVTFSINPSGDQKRGGVTKRNPLPVTEKGTSKDRNSGSLQSYLPVHSSSSQAPSQKSSSQKDSSQTGVHSQAKLFTQGRVGSSSSPAHSKPSHRSRSRSPHDKQRSSHSTNGGGRSRSSPSRGEHSKRHRSRSRSRSPRGSSHSKRSREHKHRYVYTCTRTQLYCM